MQKSGIKFWELMPRTIVPLDSAFVNLVYTAYFSAFDGFLQVRILGILGCYVSGFYCLLFYGRYNSWA